MDLGKIPGEAIALPNRDGSQEVGLSAQATPNVVARRRRLQRQRRLRELGYKDYDAYLRSPHWRQVKARYRCSDQPQDCICGETERLQVHHLTYERVGDERLKDLTLLCLPCHAMIHELERRGQIGLDFTGFVDAQRADRYAAVPRREEPVEPWEAAHQEQEILAETKRVKAKLRVLCRQMRENGRSPRRLLDDITALLDHAEAGKPIDAFFAARQHSGHGPLTQ